MTAILVLIPLLGHIFLWRRVFGSSASSAALHAPSAILLFLYLGGLANLLQPVTVLLLASGTLLAAYELTDMARRKTIFPVPLGVLLILCSLFIFLHYDNTFYLYDEFSHWGIYIKEMLNSHSFWGSDTNARHPVYLPGPPLWQYFFLRFTGFSEGGAYLAQFCFLILPLVVLWQSVRWRQVFWLFAPFALIVFTLTNFGHGFASLYVDHLLGTWFAGTIFNFMLDMKSRTPRQLLSYALPVTTLVLIKDAGLYFALAASGIIALFVFWDFAFRRSEKSFQRAFVKSGILILLCLMFSGAVSLSWKENRNAAGIGDATQSTSGIVAGITGKASLFSEAEQTELSNRFVEVVLHQQIAKSKVFEPYGEFNYDIMGLFDERYRLTTFSLILLFAIWQIFALYKLVDPGERWRWAIGATGLSVTAVIYIGLLFLSYHFAFGERAMILPSYLRYVHSGLLPLVLFMFLPLLPGFAPRNAAMITLPGNRNISRPAVIFALVITAFYAFETPHVAPLYRAHERPELRQQMKPMIDKVQQRVGANSNLWIYLPVPDPTEVRRWMFLYDMSPVRTEVVRDWDFFGDPNAINDIIANWDYLWFPTQDFEADTVMEELAGKDLKEGVFRVIRREGEVEVVALDGVFN